MMLVLAWIGAARADEVTIGSQSGANYMLPFNTNDCYSLTQQIYTADEIGMAGTITSLSFMYNKGFIANNIKIYLKEVENTFFYDNRDIVPVTEDDLAFSGGFSVAQEDWTTITLQKPFEYSGSKNLLVCFYDTNNDSPGSNCRAYTIQGVSGLYQSICYSDASFISLDNISNFSGNRNILVNRNYIKIGITPINTDPQTLTVYDGTTTRNEVPAFIYYFDDFTRSQFVIPSSDLGDMAGKTITSMMFYTTTDNVPYTTLETVDVYLKEVDYTTISAFEPKTNDAIVYQGTLSVESADDGGTLTIDFDEPFPFSGGNLLVGIENTTDLGYKSIKFYGQTVDGASISGYNESSLDEVEATQCDFIPKTTFTYAPNGTICAKPKKLTVSEITETSATVSWESDAGRWEVEYKSYASDTWLGPLTVTQPMFNITDGLQTGTTYQVRVRAVCDATHSSKWAETSFLTGVISPPDNSTPVTYYYRGVSCNSNGTSEFEAPVQLVKDGNTVYIQGLASDGNGHILPDAWARGTLSGTTLTIPTGQYMGEYDKYQIYLLGYDIDSKNIEDITFTYSVESNTYTLNNYLIVNAKIDGLYYYYYIQSGAVINTVAPLSLVEVPDGITIETNWKIDGNFFKNGSNIAVERAIEVAFDGNDVYIKGIPYYFPDAWMKGTINGNTATFASGQFVGEDDYGEEYMVGSNNLEDVVDIVFSFDSSTKTFVLTTPYLVENTQESLITKYWGYYDRLTVCQGELYVPQKVVVPENLVAEAYVWTGKTVEYDDDKNPVYTEFTKFVNIGFDGNDVYVQGLCNDIPDAWVKGTKSNNTVTFTSGQYYGTYKPSWGDYPYYFVGFNGSANCDVQFTYDSTTKTFTTNTWIGLNGHYQYDYAYERYTDNKWTYFVEKAGKPADPSFKEVIFEGTSWPRVELDVPIYDVNGNMMNIYKLYYILYSDVEHVVQPIVFTTDLYKYLDETITEVPYNYTDNYDFYKGGSKVYLNQDKDELDTFNRIGVQSIYYGGLAEGQPGNKSNIVWYNIKEFTTPISITTDIDNGQSDSVKDQKDDWYTIDGQKLSGKPTKKGVYIHHGKAVIK